MPSRDFTFALGRLLSDRRLRELHVQDSRAAASQLELAPQDFAAFAALDPLQLAEQADALLRKRFYEVAQLLPQTMARLGAAAYARFLEYAERHWPEGHRRHWLDALAFGRHLRLQRASELRRAEYNRVAFMSGGRRLFVAWVRECHALPALQILYRRKGEVRQWGISIGR